MSLALAGTGSPPRNPPSVLPVHRGPQSPRAGDEGAATSHLERLIAPFGAAPAVVRDRHLDVLASTEPARRLSAAFEPGVNIARFTFLNPIVSDSTGNWGEVAAQVAGALRRSLEEHLEDAGFRTLVGELAARSEAFNRAWEVAPARPAGSGGFDLDHPVVGRLRLTYQEFAVLGPEPGLVLAVWYPADAESADRLARLGPARG